MGAQGAEEADAWAAAIKEAEKVVERVEKVAA